MQIKDVHVMIYVLLNWFLQKSVGKHLLVAYWGQNSAGINFPNNPEKDLKDVCFQRKYEIIVIGFVVTFFGPRNKDQMPEVNFSRHCWDPVSPQHPNLYRCPKIEEGIKACQQKGKKVLISLGGATARNDLKDDKADDLARNLWDLFLGGKGRPNIRPFGSAILDGIDLDIEDHMSGGYAQLVKSLRDLEKADSSKKFLITGAPQCPFPDASLGPKPGSALGDQGGQFDHVYVQFYNNFCHTGDQAQFYPNMDKWLQFSAARRSMGGSGPKIFVGMPSAPGGAGDPQYYRPPEEVAKIYEKLKGRPNFGGFMLWDAAWDQQNVIQGKVYSDHIADITSGNAPGTPIGEAATGGTSTTGGSTTPGEIPSPAVGGSPPVAPNPPPAPAGGGGANDFCKGKSDGSYADPSNPSGYIMCSFGVSYKMNCPAGLVWNDETKNCDWPNKTFQGRDAGANHRCIHRLGNRHNKEIQAVLKRTNESGNGGTKKKTKGDKKN